VIVRREFPSVPPSVSAARRFVREVVATEQMKVAPDVVALLTSELATNAVVFGNADIFAVQVCESRRGAGIRVEVLDSNPSRPELREPDDEAVHGRGLLLVNSLATEWGSYNLPGARKAVWFEL
jgi:anti-sigma regulatory factor (Ser/Thr protein kinase)